jgi:hypothetical protein
MPPLNAGYGPSTGTALPITTALPDLDFNSEAMRFFKRSFRKGGVLVIVEPSDDVDYVQAMNILKAQGGKVLSD